MVTYPSKTTATEIVCWLQQKKQNGQGTILFLGARAGGLFRSKTLYGTSQLFSPRAFNNLSRIQQFIECYHVLYDSDFSRDDINNVLTASLQGLEVLQVDEQLAALVNIGIFDTIITTNIDDLLKRAFLAFNMHEPGDFQTFVPYIHPFENLIRSQPKSLCHLIKAFGDLELNEYNLLRRDFYLTTQTRLLAFLTETLKKDVIVLGYDPYWDRSIEMLFPDSGQAFYHVNEEEAQNSFLRILRLRKGKSLVGGEGSYEQFIQTLHWHLIEQAPPQNPLIAAQSAPYPFILSISSTGKQATGSLPALPPAVLSNIDLNKEKEQRKTIFIGSSSSQDDLVYLQQFRTHLIRYERRKMLHVWDESKMLLGAKWQAELEQTLNTTRIAILLVSSDFIASEFIDQNVLPPLLQAAEAGGAIILSVIIRHCVFEDTELQQFKTVNTVSEPLSGKNIDERDKVWADLVRYILTIVNNAQKS